MGRITVIGHYGFSLLMDVSRFPFPGETVEGLGLETEPGGKGYNQAVAASRLGESVAFITAVGDDEFGALCDAYLKDEQIEERRIIVYPGQKTACAFVVNTALKESLVMVYPGAIRSVTPADIEAHAETIIKSEILLLQNEITTEALLKAVEIGHSHGIPIVYNPAPARFVPDELFRKVDYITPNETEAAILTDADPSEPLDVRLAMQKLHEKGAKNVVITLGEKGAAISSGGAFTSIQASKVDVVSTTGAGDAFNAAFAAGVVQGRSCVGAAEFAVAISGIAVSRPGIIASLPYKKEVLHLFGQ